MVSLRAVTPLPYARASSTALPVSAEGPSYSAKYTVLTFLDCSGEYCGDGMPEFSEVYLRSASSVLCQNRCFPKNYRGIWKIFSRPSSRINMSDPSSLHFEKSCPLYRGLEDLLLYNLCFTIYTECELCRTDLAKAGVNNGAASLSNRFAHFGHRLWARCIVYASLRFQTSAVSAKTLTVSILPLHWLAISTLTFDGVVNFQEQLFNGLGRRCLFANTAGKRGP